MLHSPLRTMHPVPNPRNQEVEIGEIRMVAIPLDKINYNKVSKYANVFIFKELYPKTKNVSYHLKSKSRIQICTCSGLSVREK